MIAKDRLLMQQQIYNFLRSVTIKFEPMAEYINLNLIEKGYPVTNDRTTWKYYLNIVGRYHPSDEEMYVTSLDTQDRILFSPDVLQKHPRTMSVYKPGGLHYKRLCETYPEQVDLIKSILFPAPDIRSAILADDLSLLAYGSGYLEEAEENPMVIELKRFLKIVEERWYFTFLDDEPYFHLTFWGQLWTWLAMCLMAARESFVRTPYVHSYHIWQTLKAQGLDDYSDILDRKKAMMLYQNIGYLKANAGKQNNLILLADRLLDDFGVSIYGRKVVQESETGASNYELTPQLQAVRVPTNTANIQVEVASETVLTIQDRAFSKGLVLDNSVEAAKAKERRIGDTVLNNFTTKFLEIRPITKNKIYGDDLNVFLIETLITSIKLDIYKNPVSVIDPATGAALFLPPKDLLALYNYAVQRSLGNQPTVFPTHVNLGLAFNSTIPTPDKTIMMDGEKIYLSTQVDVSGYLAGIEYPTKLDNPKNFSEMLSRLWLKFMSHMLMDQNTSSERTRAVLNYLYKLCHTRRDETITLVDGFTNYQQWLGVDGLDIQSSILAQYDANVDARSAWANLADTIMSALIPMTDTLLYFGNFTLSDFGYSRLRQLFVQMCSYRVVFLDSTRATPKFGIGFKWSNFHNKIEFDTFSDKVIVRYQKQRTTTSLYKLNTNPRAILSESTTGARSYRNYSVTTQTTLKDSQVVHNRYRFVGGLSASTSMTSRGTIDVPYASMKIEGITDTAANAILTDEDGAYLKDSDNALIIDPNDDIPVDPDTPLVDRDNRQIIDDDDGVISDPNS